MEMTQGLWIPDRKRQEWKAELAQKPHFHLQDSFWAGDVWPFGTLGQGRVAFPGSKTASTSTVQIKMNIVMNLLQLLTWIPSQSVGKRGLFPVCPNKQVVFDVCLCTQAGRKRDVRCTNALVLAAQLWLHSWIIDGGDTKQCCVTTEGFSRVTQQLDPML